MSILTSVGIIGGADGPTAVFVAGPDINWPLIAAALGITIAAVIFLIKALRRK